MSDFEMEEAPGPEPELRQKSYKKAKPNSKRHSETIFTSYRETPPMDLLTQTQGKQLSKSLSNLIKTPTATAFIQNVNEDQLHEIQSRMKINFIIKKKKKYHKMKFNSFEQRDFFVSNFKSILGDSDSLSAVKVSKNKGKFWFFGKRQ